MAQVEQVEQVEQEGGNTITPSCKCRKWCFTLNNYEQKQMEQIIGTLERQGDYVIGEEKGAKGTPHLQGYLEFKNPRSFKSIQKLLPKAHIEKAKGNRKQNFIYCTKEGKYHTNIKDIVIPKPVKNPLDGKTLKPWQLEIINMIKEEPDDRSIYWYWEEKGNVGKTSLCKHLCLTTNCLIVNGKQNDMFNAILQWKEQKGDYPEIILVDIPRSCIDYVSWGAIEKIKDGLFYSGKYEGGMVTMNCPHLICLANCEPPVEKMSEDRWKIKQIL